MTESAIVLGVFALLALLSIAGYLVEARREKRLPALAAKELLEVTASLASGTSEWVVLGTSEDTFDSLDANPALVAASFLLRAADGRRFLVPRGSVVNIASIDGARRLPAEGVTKGGEVKVNFTFEVRPTQTLYIDPKGLTALPPDDAYRAGPAELAPALEAPLTLMGEPKAPGATTAAPGCWVAPLLVSIAGLWLGHGGIYRWILGPVALLLLFVLYVALPTVPSKVLPPRQS